MTSGRAKRSLTALAPRELVLRANKHAVALQPLLEEIQRRGIGENVPAMLKTMQRTVKEWATAKAKLDRAVSALEKALESGCPKMDRWRRRVVVQEIVMAAGRPQEETQK